MAVTVRTEPQLPDPPLDRCPPAGPYCIDLFASQDWGNGPTVATDYDYPTYRAARWAATQLMASYADDGVPLPWLGAAIESYELDELDQPVWCEDLSPASLGWLPEAGGA